MWDMIMLDKASTSVVFRDWGFIILMTMYVWICIQIIKSSNNAHVTWNRTGKCHTPPNSWSFSWQAGSWNMDPKNRHEIVHLLSRPNLVAGFQGFQLGGRIWPRELAERRDSSGRSIQWFTGAIPITESPDMHVSFQLFGWQSNSCPATCDFKTSALVQPGTKLFIYIYFKSIFLFPLKSWQRFWLISYFPPFFLLAGFFF